MDQTAIKGKTVEILTTRCFEMWNAGKRLGPTVRLHAMAYFEPVGGAMDFIKRAADNDASAARIVSLYLAIIKASHEQFKAYTDAEANEIHRRWDYYS